MYDGGMDEQGLKIRKTVLADMDAVCLAHGRSVRGMCFGDYTARQIAGWSSFDYDKKVWRDSVCGGYHLVIEREGVVEGFAHAMVVGDEKRGVIKGLCFTEAVAGKGYGRKVFEMMMAYLRGEGCERFEVAATVTGRGFYERMGFEVLCETECRLRRAGFGDVGIEGFDMVLG